MLLDGEVGTEGCWAAREANVEEVARDARADCDIIEGKLDGVKDVRRPDILPAGIADAKDDRVLRLISDWDAILEDDKLHDVVVVEDVELSEEV